MKHKAGLANVFYEVSGDTLRLYYQPHTQIFLGTKTKDGIKVKSEPIGPPDGVMARIYESITPPDVYYLDRECIYPDFDGGGPWMREHRSFERLNAYLSMFGLKLKKKGSWDLSIVKPVSPKTAAKRDKKYV